MAACDYGMPPVRWSARPAVAGRAGRSPGVGGLLVFVPARGLARWYVRRVVQVLGSNLSAALGVSVSPIPIIALILILTSPRARSIGPVFVGGWVLACAVGIAGAALLGSAAEAGQDGSAGDQGVDVLGLVIGLLFFFLAYRSFGNRPTPGQPVEPPGWLRTVDEMSGLQVFGLGVGLMLVNPKNLSLFASIGGEVAQADLVGGAWLATVAVLALVASLGALVPLGVALFGGDSAESILSRWRQWLVRHNAAITGVVLTLLGTSIAGNALSGLGGG